MPRMPMKQRLGLGERRQMIGRDQTLHGNGTQIDDEMVPARFKRRRRRGINPDAEPGCTVEEPKKYRFGIAPERARL